MNEYFIWIQLIVNVGFIFVIFLQYKINDNNRELWRLELEKDKLNSKCTNNQTEINKIVYERLNKLEKK